MIIKRKKRVPLEFGKILAGFSYLHVKLIQIRGKDEGDEVSAWLSAYLATDVRLVRIPPDHDREIPEEVLSK